MTMIGGYQWGEQCIVFGDSLVTSRRSEYGLDEVITLDDARAIMSGSESGFAVRFTQKIFMPSRRIVVAWTGALYQARAFCEKIRQLKYSSKNISERIGEFVESYPMSDVNDIEMAIIWINERGGISRRFIGTDSFDMDNLNSVFIGGSGRAAAFEAVNYIDEGIETSMIPERDLAIAFAIGACAKFQFRQAIDGTGLSQGWGGAFEVAFRDGLEFKKVKNLEMHCLIMKETREGFVRDDYVPEFRHMYCKDFALINNMRGRANVIRPVAGDKGSPILKFPLHKFDWAAFGLSEIRMAMLKLMWVWLKGRDMFPVGYMKMIA